MRTETVVRYLYKFNELSDKAKEKAIERLYDLNVDHDWWECTYEDASRIGAEISGFDTGRGNSIDFKFVQDAEEVARRILKEHGKDCETFKLAQQFQQDNDAEEFERALGEEYLSMLRREYEYLTSSEAIIESIEANDYEFTADGKLA